MRERRLFIVRTDVIGKQNVTLCWKILFCKSTYFYKDFKYIRSL